MKWSVIDMTIDEAEKIKTVVESKDYIVQLVNIIAKTMIEAFENLKIKDVNMFQLGYNKAIDDFKKMLTIEKIKEYAESDGFINLNNCSLMIFDIAEKLKVGGKNG